MYECPNCGANIKFDIESQQMLCGYCDTKMDPYAFEKDKDANEEQYFETIIYTCPQCAGQLICEDNEAAVFCPYCGGSTILTERMDKALRPTKIIPFRLTKEDCKKEYRKIIKKAIYAPKELRQEKYLESFRGIYMPYWNYTIEQDGEFRVIGEQSYQDGDWECINQREMHGCLKAEYTGMYYDASSTFADGLSEGIMPFDTDEEKDFTSAFLSGHYADVQDVDSQVYEMFAKRQAQAASGKKIRGHRMFRNYDTSGVDWENCCPDITKCKKAEITLMPVWFMCHRYDKRVMYATVNGQTGKMKVDIPIDRKKFAIGIALMAVPIFILLNLLDFVTPLLMLVLVSLLGILVLELFNVEIKRVKLSDEQWDDRGYWSHNCTPEEQSFIKGEMNKSSYKERKIELTDESIAEFIVKVIPFVAAIFLMGFIFSTLSLDVTPFLLKLIIGGIGFYAIIKMIWIHPVVNALKNIEKRRNYWLIFIAIMFAVLVAVIEPGDELLYHTTGMACSMAIGFSCLDMLYYYNIRSTRKRPQFKRQGGDDDA